MENSMKRVLFSFLLAVVFSVACLAQDSLFVRQNYTKHEYQIPMRDGIKLFTSVYAPKDASESHPILLVRTPYSVGPYGPDNYLRFLSNLTREYMKRNYIIVNQDVRGRFMSEGEFVNVRPYISDKKSSKDVDETSDTYDTIDWLVKNIPNNNGNVGVKGISYPGFYSSTASIDAHPALKATSPQAPVSKWMSGDDFFHNGAFLLSHAFDFFIGFGWPRSAPTTQDFRPFSRGTPDGYKFYMDLGPLPNANRLFMHDSVAFWNEIMEHGTWDSYWEARDILQHLKNIKPATLVVGGWFDTENLYGALHAYEAIEKNSPEGRHMLVMGPWAHGWWGADNVDSLGSIKFGSNLSAFFADELEVPFFEYHLRGIGNPTIAEATVFMTGANEWKRYDSWPPKGTKQKNLYLREKGGLSFEKPGMREGYDEYVSDPDKPVPYTNEITRWYNSAFMVEDQRFAARRPDVLVYQTEPLDEDVTIAGPIKVTLMGSTSGTDCDWIVKLIDFFPDSTRNPVPNPTKVMLGGYQMLVRGDVLRGKFRNSLARPEAYTPGKVTETAFELQAALHKFKKGHRIMVQIQSTWFPMIDRNPGVFTNIYQAKESDFRKTTQRVYRSAKESSHLTIPVLE